MMKISDLGEFGLIDDLAKGLKKSPGVIRGIGDDAAVLKADGRKRLLMTTDMLIENVHFTTRMNPRDIGWKSMACNISDIAAMGGVPKFAVVSIGLPPGTRIEWIKSFYTGLEFCAETFGVAVVGGDTVKSDKITVNVALTGEARPERVVLRGGAKPGDVICVTGPLGNSFDSDRHLTFTPRVAEAQYLVKNFKINAMIDVSDGLAADLGHILQQSRVGAILEAGAIPVHADADLNKALHDGEDYELVFTLPEKDANRLLKTKRHSGMNAPRPSLSQRGGEKRAQRDHSPSLLKEGVRGSSVFYPIGRIIRDPKSLFLSSEAGHLTAVEPQGYEHF